MSKILVNVLLPATGKKYDFWVPEDMPMGEATDYIAEAMQIAEPAFYRKGSEALLMRISTGEIQCKEGPLSDYCPYNGERFALIQ